MAIMITGGTGFIGAHLAHRLLDMGETVVLFDASPDRQAVHDMSERVTLVRGDVTALQDVLHAVKAHGVDRIVHLAYILGPENEQNPPRAIQINCMGTNNVFEVARLERLRRVVWASSVAVYGPRSFYGKESLDEYDPPNPTRVYGACKLLNEHLAEHYFQQFNVEHMALRPSVVYGPGRLRGSAQFMQAWLEDAALGGKVYIPSGAEQDTWSYIEDVAEAFLLAVRAEVLPPHRIFNIGGDFRSRRELGDYLRALLPDAQVEIGSEAIAGGYRSARHLNRRLTDALGFRVQWGLERGVKATLNWARRRAGLPPVD
ncbi:MAG: NAD(P)-dependent oxidoreductase [Nitrospinae bacterium]|nr:NAD(P)-dependent oxidoreductase [Nitrospinota bacterium]